VRRMGGTLGVGRALTRTFFLMGEVRLETIDASLPGERDQTLPGGESRPISFEVREGRSHLGSFTLLFDLDTRSDTVLPRSGHHVSLSLEGSADGFGSSYGFLKGVAQSSSYLPMRSGHVVGIHAFLGGIWGDAAYFDRFFVGDLNFLLPPRALGLNFSTQPSLDLLGTGMAGHRYENAAGRLLVEYAIPIWRRHGILYRGDAFAAFGAFAVSDPARWRSSSRFSDAVAVDLTGDLGLRLDTTIGIFTLSVGNAIGRIPF
jgi:outer membrane protein insertion porin family